MAKKKIDDKKLSEKVVLKQEQKARRKMLEELFNDWYIARKKVYIMNFVRGIAFGLGSVLGGTVVIALLIWLLSALGGISPFLGDFFIEVRDTIEEAE